MRRGSVAILLLLLMGCSIPLETVYVPAEDNGLRLGYGSDRRGTTIAEFIPSDETMGNWSRKLTIQFLEGERRSPRAFMSALESLMRARCPDAKWTVLSEDATSVMYEWATTNCSTTADQHELARLLKGNDGVHRVAYVRHGAQLDSTERDAWIKAFIGAHVEKQGKRVVVAP
jgi:hypothetical protein